MNLDAFSVTISDGLIVFATLAGPILAVQAQKFLEARGASSQRKKAVFETLMATRGAKLSLEHVRALNMIEVTYYGRSERLRSKGEAEVLSAWREYLDFLSDVNDRWGEGGFARREELFLNLLEKMAAELGYQFDRVQLRRGAYSPMAHGRQESEIEELRAAAIKVLTGKSALVVISPDFDVPDGPEASPREEILPSKDETPG
ncbi:DUF6680 family protein [Stenotrophomonas pavanii]|uniref:DUF6680 family protein n=1 Tax=Stenotrophomonas pavanii TaxID=487698 RepID=UPI002DC000BD|nr:DUF6680 family protein [Stenotrophomonas pavanii]MEC4337238.1 DUF6680 family protein [Stenotrophomonas pavanii]